MALIATVFAGLFICSSLMGQDVTVVAYGVMPNGERKANVKIEREEIERTTLLPLLPYIFFDVESAVIPNRYIQFSARESRVFSEQEFGVTDVTGRRSSIAAYYNILNIIGKRLANDLHQEISIVGSTDGKESALIGLQRAEAVRDYLHITFGIDTSRLTIRGMGLPNSPTKSDNADAAAQENRRVTIDGSWEIVHPVIVRDTTTTVSPPGVEFDVKTTVKDVAGVEIRAWQLDYDNPLYLYEHINIPKSPRMWHLDRDPSKQPTTDEDLEYEAIVHDAQHHEYESETKRLPVEQITLRRKKSGAVQGSTEVHQYNLILFDFGSSMLREDHVRIVDSLIASDGYVMPYSTVNASGYTDSTGSVDINLKLSTERAKAAADRITERFKNIIPAANVSSNGFGKSDVLRLIDGQALPESRMYSRTVYIVVQNRRER